MKFTDIPFKPAFLNEGPPFYSTGIQALVNFDNGIEVSIVMHNGSYGGTKGLYEMLISNKVTGLGLGGILPGVQDDGIIGYLTSEKVEEMLTALKYQPPVNPNDNIVSLKKEPQNA